MEYKCRDCDFDIEGSRLEIQGASDTIYRHYICRNDYPPVNEANLLYAGRKAAKTQAALLSETINRLKSTLDALEAEEARVREAVARYNIVLRPVHTLPPELLVKIFLHSLDVPVALDRAVNCAQSSSLDTSKPPWTLSQVCRSWRRISLQAPALWSWVSFAFRGGDANSLGSQLEAHRLQLRLRRSANYPLAVVASTPPGITLRAADPMVFILSSHTDHVKHLQIDLDGHNHPILPHSRGLFQALETLDIRIHQRPQLRAVGAIITLDSFEFASRLGKLILSGTPHRLNLIIPALQITSFDWTDEETPMSSLSALRPLLESLVNLQSCRLLFHPSTIASYSRSLVQTNNPSATTSIFTSLFGEHRDIRLLRLTKLETLCSTQEANGHPNCDILASIKAPYLTHLSLFASGNSFAFISQNLFITPQLIVSLRIDQVTFLLQDFSSVLAKLKSLQTLAFGVQLAGGITNEYVSLFQRTRPDTSTFHFTPGLRELQLLSMPGLESSYDGKTLILMLEARRRKGSGVSDKPEFIAVLFDRRIRSQQLRRRLDTLISKGLKVTEV